MVRYRIRRKIRTLNRLGYIDLIAYVLNTTSNVDIDPCSYEEAISCQEVDEWTEVMHE